MPTTPQTYKSSGVDRNSAEEIKRRIMALASKTHGPNVLGGIGGFGALFQIPSYKKATLSFLKDELSDSPGDRQGIGYDRIDNVIKHLNILYKDKQQDILKLNEYKNTNALSLYSLKHIKNIHSHRNFLNDINNIITK